MIHDYATAPLISEVRGLPATYDPSEGQPGIASAEAAWALAASMDKYLGVNIGNVFACEGGTMVTGSYFSATAYDQAGQVVRSRKTAELYGQIDQGNVSSALGHLGGISHALGRATPVGETQERIKGDAALAEAHGRMLEHLAANRVNPAQTPTVLGATLAIDPATERCIGDGAAAANALFRRDDRVGYAVPQLT